MTVNTRYALSLTFGSSATCIAALPHQFGEKRFRIVESVSLKTDSVIVESRTERITEGSYCTVHSFRRNIEPSLLLTLPAEIEIPRFRFRGPRNRLLTVSASRARLDSTVAYRARSAGELTGRRHHPSPVWTVLAPMELPTLPTDRSHSHSLFVNQQHMHFTSTAQRSVPTSTDRSRALAEQNHTAPLRPIRNPALQSAWRFAPKAREATMLDSFSIRRQQPTETHGSSSQSRASVWCC